MNNELNELDELVKKVAELNVSGKRLFMLRIFENKVIDFSDVAACYVKTLEEENTHRRRSVATLGLMLASYCITDSSPGGKNSRSHLYQSGAFTEQDGSAFGKMLSEEFKNTKEDK